MTASHRNATLAPRAPVPRSSTPGARRRRHQGPRAGPRRPAGRGRRIPRVVGPSGSGKSCLLAVRRCPVLPGLRHSLRPRPDLRHCEPSQRRPPSGWQTSAFVFQSGNLMPALTAADQLRLVNKPRRRTALLRPDAAARLRRHGAQGEEPARTALRRRAPAGGHRPRPGHHAAACCWSTSPPPRWTAAAATRSSNCSPSESHDHGVATVMVTHDHDVLGHCDRILEMVDGSLVEPAAHG